MQEIVLILVALYWIGVGIYRFFKWIAKQAKQVSGGPAPMQQALAAQRQAEQLRLQQIQQRQQVPAWQMPRQPEAGGLAVPREATSQDFGRQEQELLTEEPAALGVALQTGGPQASSSPRPLFEGRDDLVRAIILQEALGPPLSRRRR